MLKLQKRIDKGKMFFIVLDYSEGCIKDMFYFSEENQYPLIENKIYEIIIFKPNNGIVTNYNYDDYLLGPIQKQKKEELFIAKWMARLEEIEKILKNTTNLDLVNEQKSIIKNIGK